MKARIFSFFMVAMLFCTAATPVFAVNSTGNTVGGGIATTNENSVFKDSNKPVKEDDNKQKWWEQEIESPEQILHQDGKVVTIEDATSLVNRKMGEVTHFVQDGLAWVCIICFFGCIALLVIGAMGNKRLLVAGLLGMLICGIAYTIVICGPQVMNAFSSWLKS